MKLLILHYRQKELYPPLMNMLSLLESQNIDYKLVTGSKGPNSNHKAINKVLIFANYFRFLIKSFYSLISRKQNVLYYESISALPLVLYTKLFRHSRLNIFIHFHEYFSNDEYKRQSFLSRLGRKYELNLFPKAKWISHTNRDRIELFKKDIGIDIDKVVLHELPNYPSQYWNTLQNIETEKKEQKRIRLLHIGSISFNGLYITELLEHFGNQEKFELHFYSHSKDLEIINWLKGFGNVFYHGSIDYKTIPMNLYGKFDVGLVLYKGNSLNFTYNVPNKVFEYLALDLDVWCSDKLLTAKNFVTKDTYPKVVIVNYEDLQNMDITEALDKTDLKYSKSYYFYENEYYQFIDRLKALQNEEN